MKPEVNENVKKLKLKMLQNVFLEIGPNAYLKLINLNSLKWNLILSLIFSIAFGLATAFINVDTILFLKVLFNMTIIVLPILIGFSLTALVQLISTIDRKQLEYAVMITFNENRTINIHQTLIGTFIFALICQLTLLLFTIPAKLILEGQFENTFINNPSLFNICISGAYLFGLMFSVSILFNLLNYTFAAFQLKLAEIAGDTFQEIAEEVTMTSKEKHEKN